MNNEYENRKTFRNQDFYILELRYQLFKNNFQFLILHNYCSYNYKYILKYINYANYQRFYEALFLKLYC